MQNDEEDGMRAGAIESYRESQKMEATYICIGCRKIVEEGEWKYDLVRKNILCSKCYHRLLGTRPTERK